MKRKNILLLSGLLAAALLTSCGIPSDLAAETNPESADASSADSEAVGSTAYIVLPEGTEYAELYTDSEQSSVIARMYQGESITVSKINDNRAMVTYGGLTGYTPLPYISFSKPAETQPQTEAPPVTAAQTQAQTQPAAVPPEENNMPENLFFTDDDGFDYADPIRYSTYVSDTRDAWCSAHSVYIFAEPSTSSAKREANMLYYGDSVTVLGTVDNFYYIATDSGCGYDLHGYVNTSYITYGQSPLPPEPENPTQGVVTGGSANARSSPNKETNDNVLFVMHEGDKFDVISYDGYWYKINYNGTTCYISHKMVDVW